MQHPYNTPTWRCPWFWAGLAAGLALGLWCIDTSSRQADHLRPPFAVISSEP